MKTSPITQRPYPDELTSEELAAQEAFVMEYTPTVDVDDRGEPFYTPDMADMCDKAAAEYVQQLLY